MTATRAPTPSLSPDDIRALRGRRSRAAFAQVAGVTPLTVYRWELPDDAPEARRPRGAPLARLRALTPDMAPPPRASTSAHEEALVLPALDRIARGDWRRSESELLTLLAEGRLATAPARALAAVGLAEVQLLLRGDARAAFATLAPAIADGDANVLPPAVDAQVRAVSALVFSWPDARLFDVGRVHASAARAEALLGPNGMPDVRFLAWLAGIGAAFQVGDAELLDRALGHADEAISATLPPLLAAYADEATALDAMVHGKPTLAARRFEELVVRAERDGYALVLARALAFLALRRLDDLAPPETALALARRSQEVAREARLGLGLHSTYAARGEAEALVRLGRFPEAEAAFATAHATADEMGMPAIPIVSAHLRFLFLTGRYEPLRALGARLRAFELPALRSLVGAYSAAADALLELAVGEDSDCTLEAFARAERASTGWLFLQREVIVFGVAAYLAAGRLGDAELAVRRAQRFLDRFPSPWSAATLRRFEGTLLALQDRWSEARQLLEAALGTFTLAGDEPDAALTRRTIAHFADARARANGDAEAEAAARALVAASDAEMAALGIVAPLSFRASSLSLRAIGDAPVTEATTSLGLAALVVPLQRLSVRGVGPMALERELVAVARGLFADRAVRLEEVGPRGETSVLGAAGGDAPGEVRGEWVEFGDGAGRRLRLGVEGPLGPERRGALTALGAVAGLALEVATLRGFAHDGAAARSDAHPDLDAPGFIAVSPAMRRLKGELGRLAASRSTIIVTGESGAGKEVVARAIHHASTRRERPCVAFNCTAVPRALFEGQLFGYRRGAFTGAVADHVGVVRAADGGTLFLDEVGDLPLDVQPKLLRFLENGEVLPLGETRPVKVDVRVVAATHRDLATMVREGKFREDLYYRLQVVPLHVPPLRERREDLAALARHFVGANTPFGDDPPVLAEGAVARLARHAWPGNVRELRNVIERSMAFAPLPAVLTAEDLRM